MARDRANINTRIWTDHHWRSLSMGAQWLYEFLLSSSTLNLCGVTDWRPAKWSGMAADLSKGDLEKYAAELERESFIVIDRATEEVCLRSFFRHDGILAQPNPMKGAVREFGSIGSEVIRGVIAHELQRLREEFPEGIGKGNVWVQVEGLETLLKTPPVDVRNPSPNPSVNPSHTSTSTYTSSNEEKEPAPAVRVSESDFEKAYSHWPKKVERKQAFERFKIAARKRGLDQITADVIRFGDAYAATTDRKFVPALGVWLGGERWTDELPGTQLPAQSSDGRREEIVDGIRFVNGKPTVGGPHGMTPAQYRAWQDRRLA